MLGATIQDTLYSFTDGAPAISGYNQQRALRLRKEQGEELDFEEVRSRLTPPVLASR